MNTKFLFPIFFLLAALLMAACQPAPSTPQVTQTSSPQGPQTLSVITHDSFAVSEAVVAAFEQQHNARVQFIKSGDAGATLNKAILSRDNPLGDVLFGVDNTFLSRALAEDIFEPYNSPLLAQVPAEFRLDDQNRLLPIDYGDVCPNYDIAYFEDKGLAPPQTLDDLLEPQYKGLLVVQNPATSSPGLAFLLTTVANYGADGYLEYWQGLAANDVLVVNGWDTAYYSEFSLHGGTRPIVISYGSSPPAEVIFAEQPLETAPTAVVTGGRACFRQVEFAGILKGSQERKLAEQWLDFMLSLEFQQDMPLQMFVYPVNPQAALPDEFVRYSVIPQETAALSPDEIAAGREAWLQAWTETVLR
jgi:thiamine transport system substrate-binding protein